MRVRWAFGSSASFIVQLSIGWSRQSITTVHLSVRFVLIRTEMDSEGRSALRWATTWVISEHSEPERLFLAYRAGSQCIVACALLSGKEGPAPCCIGLPLGPVLPSCVLMMSVVEKTVDGVTEGGISSETSQKAFSSAKRRFCLFHVALVTPRTPFRDWGSNPSTQQVPKRSERQDRA